MLIRRDMRLEAGGAAHTCLDSLFLLGRSVCRRSHSDNLQYTGLILCAVVVDFFAVMNDEAAGWNGLKAGRIILRTGIHPPCSRKYVNVTIVRMEMWTAVMMGKPLLKNHVKPGLRRIAQQHRCLSAGIRIRNPFDIFGKLYRNRFWIEIRGIRNTNPHK